MHRIAQGDVDRAAMGAASRRIVAEWGPERFASGLKQAVACVLAGPGRKLGIVDRVLIEVCVRR